MKETVKLKESQLRDIVRESIVSILSEKAKSKSQQRFFGMVDAYKKGELDDASPAVKKAAKGMTNKEVKDFAKTKHKGLPNHVDESALANAIRESIKKVLKESDFISHGYKTTSNLGGKEIEISRNNDAVRFRTEDGSVSNWFEIEYNEQGEPVANTPWGTEPLGDYMRTNFSF